VRTPLTPLIPISNPDPSERQHNNHPTRSNSQCHFRLAAVASPEGEWGEASPYGWTSKNYVICVCFHCHGTSSASKCVSFWRTSYSRYPIDPYLTSPLLQNPGDATASSASVWCCCSCCYSVCDRSPDAPIQALPISPISRRPARPPTLKTYLSNSDPSLRLRDTIRQETRESIRLLAGGHFRGSYRSYI